MSQASRTSSGTPADRDALNLGPRTNASLRAIGIRTLGELRQTGSVQAFHRIKQLDPFVTLNMLWAFEAALTGVSWLHVARHERTGLLLALDDLGASDKSDLKSPRRPA